MIRTSIYTFDVMICMMVLIGMVVGDINDCIGRMPFAYDSVLSRRSIGGVLSMCVKMDHHTDTEGIPDINKQWPQMKTKSLKTGKETVIQPSYSPLSEACKAAILDAIKSTNEATDATEKKSDFEATFKDWGPVSATGYDEVWQTQELEGGRLFKHECTITFRVITNDDQCKQISFTHHHEGGELANDDHREGNVRVSTAMKNEEEYFLRWLKALKLNANGKESVFSHKV